MYLLDNEPIRAVMHEGEWTKTQDQSSTQTDEQSSDQFNIRSGKAPTEKIIEKELFTTYNTFKAMNAGDRFIYLMYIVYVILSVSSTLALIFTSIKLYRNRYEKQIHATSYSILVIFVVVSNLCLTLGYIMRRKR